MDEKPAVVAVIAALCFAFVAAGTSSMSVALALAPSAATIGTG